MNEGEMESGSRRLVVTAVAIEPAVVLAIV